MYLNHYHHQTMLTGGADTAHVAFLKHEHHYLQIPLQLHQSPHSPLWVWAKADDWDMNEELRERPWCEFTGVRAMT